MSLSTVGAQATGTTVDSAASATQAFPASVTNGNRIIVLCAKGVSGTHRAFVAGDCTKSAGTATLGTITLDATTARDDTGSSGVWADVGIWSALVTGSGTLTMAVAGAASTYYQIGVDELNSTGGTITVGTNAVNNSTGTTTPDSGNVTPANYQAALYGILCVTVSSGTIGMTPDGAFTQIFEEENGSAHNVSNFERRIMSSGIDSASWTLATTDSFCCLCQAYLEPSGPPQPVASIASYARFPKLRPR